MTPLTQPWLLSQLPLVVKGALTALGRTATLAQVNNHLREDGLALSAEDFRTSYRNLFGNEPLCLRTVVDADEEEHLSGKESPKKKPGGSHKGEGEAEPARQTYFEPQRQGAAAVLLGAARRLAQPFTGTALVLAAWNADPHTFGLQDAEHQHPDARQVWTRVYGKRGLLARGLLKRVGNRFAVGTAGLPGKE